MANQWRVVGMRADVQQMNPVVVHPEVEDALRLGRAVVALESAVITTGLPREAVLAGTWDSTWRSDQPVNLELALYMERLVRDWAAVPATIAVLDGTLHVGLEQDQLHRLAADVHEKVSVTGLAAVMSSRGSAGTTVSAALAACRLTRHPIRVFATGGIGGVHRNWTELPDISADLRQMAITPTCVVSAGAKSILDLPATVEALESLGVPVIGFGTDQFPQFQSLGTDAIRTPRRIDDIATMAQLCHLHWQSLSNTSGVMIANPVPSSEAMSPEEVSAATQEAEQLAIAADIRGAARTPFLLAELARLTEGRSLRANIALLANNAKLAAELSVALTSMP